MHVGYGCRHSGACCTAGWAIPVEGPAFEMIRVHFKAGTEGDAPLFRTGGPLPEGAAAILNIRRDGACVFFDAAGGRLCRVHRDLGPQSLPIACRQFPRVVLHDRRGTFISLSHYCPTAAALLATGDPVSIVTAPASLTIDGEAEGLDARDALPPLLHPGVLMDLTGYDGWERRALAVLGDDRLTAITAIGTIDDASRRLQDWKPGRGTLADAADREFAVARPVEADEDLPADAVRLTTVYASVPEDLRPSDVDRDVERGWSLVAPWWPGVDRVVRSYLMARLFGNWIAYHGQGLHAIVEYLRLCRSVLKIETARAQARTASRGPATTPWQTVTEAIRNSDLLLMHLSDPKDLARRLG
jgi:Fe-S-cluster containining protein